MAKIHELLNQNRKNVQKQRRKEWRKEHIFDIVHVILTAAAIIISLIALVVSILAFNLQVKSFQQPSDVEPQCETAQSESNR